VAYIHLSIHDGVDVRIHDRPIEPYHQAIVTLDNVIEGLVRPALLALGFHPESVEESLGLGEYSDD